MADLPNTTNKEFCLADISTTIVDDAAAFGPQIRIEAAASERQSPMDTWKGDQVQVG